MCPWMGSLIILYDSSKTLEVRDISLDISPEFKKCESFDNCEIMVDKSLVEKKTGTKSTLGNFQITWFAYFTPAALGVKVEIELQSY
jgi:hypothetical protein